MASPTTSTASLPLITIKPTSTPILDAPEVDNANCALLGGFAIAVQLLMGIMVMGTLIWKRQREKPRRPWKIWVLDISKQMLGQLFVHSLNVLLSSIIANVGDFNPCSLYLLNILVDTTLGVAIIYLTLRITTHILTDVMGRKGFVSGQYTDSPAERPFGRKRANRRPKVSYWFKQLAAYFFALFTMKVVVTILFAIFPFLFAFGEWVLDLFGERRNVQVLFVMCLFPLMMNTIQFWLVDTLLRHDPVKSKYSHKANSSEDQIGGSDVDGRQDLGDGDGSAWGLRSEDGPRSRAGRSYDTSEERDGLVGSRGSQDDEDDEDIDEEAEGVPHAQSQATASQARNRNPPSRTSSPASGHSYPPKGTSETGSIAGGSGRNSPHGSTASSKLRAPAMTRGQGSGSEAGVSSSNNGRISPSNATGGS